MVHKIIAGNQRAKELAKSTNIRRSTINMWTKRYRDGSKLRENTGRPAALDSTSIAKIKQFYTANPDCSDEELKQNIREEAGATKLRRDSFLGTTKEGHSSAAAIRKITIYKYLRLIKSVNDAPDVSG